MAEEPTGPLGPVSDDPRVSFATVGPVGPNPFAEPSDIVIGPVGPRRHRSVVRRGGTLGCGTYTVAVEPRGGGPTLMRLDMSDLTFERPWSQVGSCEVGVSGVTECSSVCADMLDLRPWRHELVFYRTARDEVEEVFRGPIARVRVKGSTGRIYGYDLSAWLRKRYLRIALTPTVPIDPTELAAAVVGEAMLRDPSPGLVSRRVGVVGVDVAPELPRWQKASDALATLVQSGLAWSVIGREILLGDANLIGTEVMTRLHEFDFAEPPEVEWDGDAQANEVTVIPEELEAGVQEDDYLYSAGRQVDADSDGLLEDVVKEPVISRREAALSAWDRSTASRVAPIHITGGTLTQDAPVTMNQLRQGTLLGVSVEGCMNVEQVLRLTGVKCSAVPGSEAVEISVSKASEVAGGD